MRTWSEEELGRIAATDDLHIAPFRDDGTTYGTLTWIWSVVINGTLYVRAYNGQSSTWYQAALKARGGTHHCCRYDEGSNFCSCRRCVERPHR
jgi:hypothetical protein